MGAIFGGGRHVNLVPNKAVCRIVHPGIGSGTFEQDYALKGRFNLPRSGFVGSGMSEKGLGMTILPRGLPPFSE